MTGEGIKRHAMIATAAVCLLTACGGGASSPAAFADAIGVGTAPAPAPAPTPSPTPQAPPTYRSFFVDYQNGDDQAAGTTKSAAWKHAPGDPNASGAAAAFVPQAGDHIVLVAGSRYYGSIKAEWTGTQDKPIVIEGEGNDHRAVIDGAHAVASLEPCSSQAACNGVAAWRSVHIARFAEALPAEARLFVDGQVLAPAQWPDPKDLFYSDETADMAQEAGTTLNAGRAGVDATVATAMQSPAGASIAVWVQGNRIVERPITKVASNTVLFDVGGVNSYTDRPGRFALRGHSALISRAGEYAVLPDRKTALVQLATPASTIAASAGRSGIDLSGASHVVVRGLTFQNMSDLDGNVRTGMPIWAMRSAARDLTIENNRFVNTHSVNQMGAVTIWKTDGLLVRNNYFGTLMTQSAVRVLNSSNAVLRENTAERISATVMLFMNNADSTIFRNRIRDAKGVHGNGITAYLGNKNTKILANTITETVRPITIKGNNEATPSAENLLIANNLLVATGDSVGSLISWGGVLKGVTIFNNVILGAEKGALKPNAEDRNVVIKRNVIEGTAFAEAYPSDWSVSGNAFTRLGPFQKDYTPQDVVVASLQIAIGLAGQAPANLSIYCPYVTEIEEYLFLGNSYGRHVGADFTCG